MKCMFVVLLKEYETPYFRRFPHDAVGNYPAANIRLMALKMIKRNRHLYKLINRE